MKKLDYIVRIDFKDSVKLNNTIITSIYINKSDVPYLLKESLEKEFRFEVANEFFSLGIKAIPKEFFKDIILSDFRAFKAKKVVSSLMAKDCIFEISIEDAYEPYFNTVGCSKDNILVTVNKFYIYNNGELIIK